MPDPDVAAILRKREQLTRIWHPLWRKVDGLEEVVKRRHKLHIPKRARTMSREVRTSHLSDIVRRVVAILTANYPVPHVTPRGGAKAYQENADRRERWTASALLQLERQWQRRVWRMLQYSAVVYGIAIQKLLWWPEAWQGKGLEKRESEGDDDYTSRKADAKKGLKLPFFWHDVDPRTYSSAQDEYGLADVFETHLHSLGSLAQRYGFSEARLMSPVPTLMKRPKKEQRKRSKAK